MKRVIVWVMTLLFLCTAIAESNVFGLDWTQYDEGELRWLIANLYEAINQANDELAKREKPDYRTYQFGDVQTDVAFYAYNDNSILIEYDWLNASNKATCFHWNVVAKAFQNGAELSDWILNYGDIDNMDTEKVLPGYGKKSYHYFRLVDDSDVTIIVSDIYSQGNTEKGTVFTVRVQDLKPFESR